ncbi:hypothetical protein OESDEN_24448, partial [Oesophagostomum dentatum]
MAVDSIRNESTSDVANPNSGSDGSADHEAVNGSHQEIPQALEDSQTNVANTVRRPVLRHFNYVPVNTVSFALPDGYSTSRSDIEFLGSGAYGNVIKTLVECRDGEVRAVAVKKFRDPFSDQLQV